MEGVTEGNTKKEEEEEEEEVEKIIPGFGRENRGITKVAAAVEKEKEKEEEEIIGEGLGYGESVLSGSYLRVKRVQVRAYLCKPEREKQTE
ncbi:hypothetical protein E2C01_100767 [Portunus trituberculatus]|uniref:Uncharacterized protein n=1 Tax=Portunus trituberculatus TaxID=210409 RepID=A0A5B7KDV4_PORTR|nr:hypothetical protein [Portunus trituberculatus]